MTILYADTSALVRAYFTDEPEHDQLRTLLLEGADPVVASELARIEFASAVAAAFRSGRTTEANRVRARFDADCGDDNGVITLLRLDPGTVFGVAYDLVTEHRLRTLEAIHVAVAMTDVVTLAAGEPIAFVTRDHRQAAAASANGLTVA